VLFKFIKYTQPGWQFNLIPSAEGSFASCYISEQTCPVEYLDERYETRSAQLADAGYYLWNKGVLLESTTQDINLLHASGNITLKDEYVFVRKYWGSSWAAFALMVRLLTFHNPFKEIDAFFATRSIRRTNVYEASNMHKDFEGFESGLVAFQPLVSVIIPTLNRYDYLKDVLRDLEKQCYKHFEVVVVDQSDNFQNDFYGNFNLNIKVFRQKEKLLWTARNKAIDLAKGSFLLFFDDDSRVEPDWIFQHLKCIDYFTADISAGVSLAHSGGKVSPSYNFFRWADQFDSGNAMVKRNVFEHIGVFDEQFNKQRMGDGEFGLRAYINGIRSISNPKASRQHLKVATGGLREMGSWDGFRSKKLFAPKPIPSVTYLYYKYFPRNLRRNALFMGMMFSNVPYKYKRNSSMLLISMFITFVKAPLLVVQFYRSRMMAKKMLQQTSSLVKIQKCV
jgi:glycosyltransferase involved in cell wall biosynthesis